MRAIRVAFTAALAVASLAGCKSKPENGYAVDVTVTADSSLASSAAEIATLDVSTSGAETFHSILPINGQLASGGAKFVYRPAATSGALQFAIAALDDDGNTLGFGSGTATLQSGSTVTLSITLGAGNIPSTDMSMCPPPCPNLGDTQCAGTQVQTCQTVDGCLTWAPAADCGTNMLCCGSACVAADVDNCYACGTACSGNTPACLSTPQKCGCIVATCAASNMGCDTSTGDCVACTALPANATDFYVDATSFAGGTGSAACPYKTITAALTAANASTGANKVIHIAAGMYATGETFPLVVRKGISLAGAGASSTTIQGTGALDHSAAGGALNGAAYNVTILTGDQTGTTTLSGLTITNTLTVATASYLGVFCDQGNAANTISAPPPAPLPTATTVLSGVAIGPKYDYGIIAATTTTPASLGGCNLKVVGSAIDGNNNGLWVVGCGAGIGKISVATALGDGTAAGGNSFTNTKNAGGGIGVLGYDCVSPLTLDNNTFDGDDNGVVCTNHSGAAGGDGTLPQADVYEVRNNVFKNISGTGLEADRGVVIDQLVGNSFTNVSSGASSATPAAALRFTTTNSQVTKARGNTIVGNDIGIDVEASAFVAGTRPSFDWGSAADPGKNVFACNSSAHIGGIGGDFRFEMATGSTVTIPLAGNKWDHVPPMQSATAADGLDVHLLNPVTLDVSGAALAGVTCPAGHIP